MTANRCPRDGCPGDVRDGACEVCGERTIAIPRAVDRTPATEIIPRGHRPLADRTRIAPPAHAPSPLDAATTLIARHESDTARVTDPAADRHAPDSTAVTPEIGAADTDADSRPVTQRSYTRVTDRNYRPRRVIVGEGIDDDLEGVDAVAPRDPAEMLLVDPQVRESLRFCASCSRPVGRGPGGTPGPPIGTCSRCGTPYSFVPPLRVGDLVGGQYEVLGALAHGGNGWIYLAIDRRVDDRLVVLKGLIDSTDDHARAAAIAERRFLAQLNDPRIVKIHNFVEEHSEDGSSSDYIVMEYVDGKTLRQLLEEHRAPGADIRPMPTAAAIEYARKILPAFDYLHRKGLAYCDFKPDNVMQHGRKLALIDLGAVIRMDDEISNLYGTVGYQAPEIATRGPSVQSDLYTVGRTLAVLALGIPPVTRDGKPSPLPADHPLLDANESLHRLLRRATHADPRERFVSAAEMRDQLDRVKLEVDARTLGKAQVPKLSLVFEASRQTCAADLLLDGDRVGRPDPAIVADNLPLPVVDHTDPGAALLANTSTEAAPDEIDDLIGILGFSTPELVLALVRAHLHAREWGRARTALAAAKQRNHLDWQPTWHRGLLDLAGADPAAAMTHFNRCFDRLPGETAVKLALGAAAECAGEDGAAERYYQMVNMVDSGQADAAFGLARVRLRSGESDRAVVALDSVPESSSLRQAAQLAAIQARLAGVAGTDEAGLRKAAVRVERLSVDKATDARVRIDLFAAAVGLVADGRSGDGPSLLGTPWTERDLRSALESELKKLARMTTDPYERVALVDRANRERPRTWL